MELPSDNGGAYIATDTRAMVRVDLRDAAIEMAWQLAAFGRFGSSGGIRLPTHASDP